MADTFTFAQLSDPHLSSLAGVRWRDLAGKRLLGYLSWRVRRRAEHRREVLDALARDLEEVAPDHVVVTGDLTHLGLPHEYREAEAWMGSLGPPERVTVIPGNHDAYGSMRPEETLELWAPHMRSDPDCGARGVGEGMRLFPLLRVRGAVAILGLSTARPSWPLFAVGSVGSGQLEALDRLLAETGERGLYRVLLVHHPPVPGTVPWRKRLTDGAALCRVLERRGVELVLHGHAHRSIVRHVTTPAGRAPVIGVRSSSALGLHGHHAQYHLYRVERAEEGWRLRVEVRGLDPERERFVAQGELELGAREAAETRSLSAAG
jgi:3',5'-cyclic AMP phosphodiesterase CpdA